MNSPFPGMDPYLEQYWGDVHTTLMVYARNQINEQLPDDLQARVEEGVSVEIDEEFHRTVYPDVRVIEEPGAWSTGTGAVVAEVSVAEPCVLEMEDDPQTRRHLEIVDLSDGGRVVTAIEILSPGNKVGLDGQVAYVRKQREYLDGRINLVEIDLIRAGEFVLAAPPNRIPAAFRTPYQVVIRRANKPGRVEIYRAPLRERLPNIPIPLRRSDPDIVLQLQPLIDACYRDGRYHRINYRVDPIPRLGEADALWVDRILREQGIRPSPEAVQE